LKTPAAKILVSLMLLFTFLTGQVIVFAHTHKADTHNARHYTAIDKSKNVEDCPICVQYGNVHLLPEQSTFFFWAFSSLFTPVAYTAIYQSIPLLLSGNRGPPAL
jgi:hypothetical protein